MRTINTILLSALLLLGSGTAVRAEEYPYQEEDHPPITSGYLYLTDTDNGQVLWTVGGEERIYPASMTKVMSAVIMIEGCPELEETVRITDAMWSGLIEANASVAGFLPGDEPTVRELLYGVLLPSGADADNALAMTYFGGTGPFVDRMNQKAAELGMASTHFANCTGLHDPDHYSTVHDISILMEYALQNPLFCEILGTREYTTRPLLSHPEGLTLESTSWPLINDGPDTYAIPGFLGGKTGYTVPAGRCFTSHAEFNGMHLVLTTAHSEGTGHLADAASVYTWYAEHYERKTLLSAGEHLTEVTVNDTLPEVIFEVAVPETVTMDLPAEAAPEIVSTVPERIQAPLAAGDVLGTLTVTVQGQTVYETTIVSETDAEYSTLAHIINTLNALRGEHPFLFWTAALLIILLVLLLILIIRRTIRRRIRRARRRKRAARKKTDR